MLVVCELLFRSLQRPSFAAALFSFNIGPFKVLSVNSYGNSVTASLYVSRRRQQDLVLPTVSS